MKKIFLTFADSNMSRALTRIRAQAFEMNLYDIIIAANENNLNINFREEYKEYLVSSVRGFGYWIWKAQLILQTLDQMNEGDLLQYTDAGCHLNFNGREKLFEYFQRVQQSKSGILGFQANEPDFHNNKIILPDLRDCKWCKGDLIDFLGVRENSEIMNSQSIGATIIFIKKTDVSMDIIQRWFNVYKDKINMIDNSESISKNMEGFVEHRHDQSIFSLLGKMHRIDTVSAYEYWYPSAIIPMLPDWKILNKYPIHAKRDKGIHWAKKPYALILRILKRVRLEMRKRGS
jgi:hypothetical protein